MKSPKTIASLIVLVLILVLGLVWMSRRDAVEDLAEADPLEAEAMSEAPVLEEELIDLLETSDMSDPAVRERIVGQVREREEAIREATHAKAKRLGIPIREVYPDGTIIELMGFDGDRPIYNSTQNVNAAISSGASQIRKQAAPYDLTGSGVTVGVWDGGVALSDHQEFNDGDVEIIDNLDLDLAGKIENYGVEHHPTHVIGTITAKGIDLGALGMAPSSRVNSYDWNLDISEMLLAGAGTANETKRVPISNHSYGKAGGYRYTRTLDIGLPTERKEWAWNGQQVIPGGKLPGSAYIDESFGRYNDYANSIDTVAFSLPYLAMFWAAANERDNNPAVGDKVAGVAGETVFNTATCPKGDGQYRVDDKGIGGYETISNKNLAKNAITVGAIYDAVADDGSRSLLPTKAKMSEFSSWGPTDDGRIKPDIVANGVSVYSPIKDSKTSYASWPGTSMATPSAAGSAALLAELYQKSVSTKWKGAGFLMPSSMMKALLIHTADDLGAPGPDYAFGWGLINVKAAADIILDHKKDPEGNPKLIEGAIFANKQPFTRYFQSDGRTPIRATLCWTDPAGPVQVGSDSRTPVLSHNLDLIITGPNGEIHQPFKMPYVGDWSVAKLSAEAIRGKNDTDNVEQVFDRTRPTLNGPGLYKVTVSLDGSLKKGIAKQNFSLVLTGGIPMPQGKAWIELDDSLDFGEVAVGSSRTLNLQIRNVAPPEIMSEADLNVTGIDFPGSAELTGSFNGVIKPGTSEVVAITYTPKAVAASQRWFGTLRVLCNSATGSRTTVPLGRAVRGTKGVPPQLRLPQPGTEMKVNYIDNLSRSEWSYDWPGESYTNRFAFDADGTVRIFYGVSRLHPPTPGYRTSDVQAGFNWQPVGPNQIAIYGPKKTVYSSDTLILKFTSENTFEAKSLDGKSITGRRYGEREKPGPMTDNLAGTVFSYPYFKREGTTVDNTSTNYETSLMQLRDDGTVKPAQDNLNKHGLWDNVTWAISSWNVIRLFNASTNQEMYMHLVPWVVPPDGSKTSVTKYYVAVGWQGSNVDGAGYDPGEIRETKDLTERNENLITGIFGGIEMVWQLPKDNKKGYWLAKDITTQGQWFQLMGKRHSLWSGSPSDKSRPVENATWGEVRDWIKKMNETHQLPAGKKWATEPREPLAILPGQAPVSIANGFSAVIVAE